MGAKKDIFDQFLEKNFGDESVRIEKPIGGERTSTPEDRAAAAAGAMASVAGESEVRVEEAKAGEKGRPGRPKSSGRGPTVFVNFLIDKDVKHALEVLKVQQYRSSLTELFMEAVVDLLKKYKVEGY